MKISIISDGYQYSDVIQKTATENKTEATAQAGGNVAPSEFESILKKIQEEVMARINGSQMGTNAVNEPKLNPYATEGSVLIRANSDDYESIAPENLQPIFKEAANTYGIDQKLLELVAYHESRFRSDVVSSAGAVGIMQLMPGTAAGLGVTDSYDARENIMGGAQLLKKLSDSYGGDLDLTVAAYNAGAGAVRKYEGVPPYQETQNYVKWIKDRY